MWYVAERGCRIEPYKTPQGDGNPLSLITLPRLSALNLIKPRKGTETLSSFHMKIADGIEPYKTPQGDGNQDLSRLRLRQTIEPYKTPQGDGNFVFAFRNIELAVLNLIKPRKGTETEIPGLFL